MSMDYLDIDIKHVADFPLRGEFSGVAASYNNLDRNGEIIDFGAMSQSIANKSEIPLLWQHDRDSPIGICRLEEAGNEIRVFGKLSLDVPLARQALALMIKPSGFSSAPLRELSIGYLVKDSETDRYGVRHLTDIEVLECSIVSIAANPRAQILKVASFTPAAERAIHEAALRQADSCWQRDPFHDEAVLKAVALRAAGGDFPYAHGGTSSLAGCFQTDPIHAWAVKRALENRREIF